MIEKRLRDRWATPSGRELAMDVVRWLGGGGAPPLGLAEHDGRVDLRGLPLPPPSVLQSITLDGVSWSVVAGSLCVRGRAWADLDLEGATLPSMRFFDCTVERSRFDGAVCRDWRLWSSSVSDSTFDRADLRASALGTWQEGRGNLWRRVGFAGANLQTVLFYGGMITEAAFANANLKGAKFQQCLLERSTFGGPLVDVLFDGRDLPDGPPGAVMRSVDFSAASFVDVEFRGCRFDGVTMPPGVVVVPDFPSVMERALRAVADDPSLEGRMLAGVLRSALRLPGSAESVGVFSRADYTSWGGAAFADLAEQLLVGRPG